MAAYVEVDFASEKISRKKWRQKSWFAVTAHQITPEEHSSKEDIKLFTIQINKKVQQMDEQDLQSVMILMRMVRRALAVKISFKKKKEAIPQGELQKRLHIELVREFQKHGREYPVNLKNASAREKIAVKEFEAGWNLIGNASIEDLKTI